MFGFGTQQQQPTGSMFSSLTTPSAQQQQQQPTFTGAFGTQQQPQATAGGFGGFGTQPQPQQPFGTPSLTFGSSTLNTNQSQPQTNSIFGGQQTAPSAGGSLFGGSTAQSGSLFGNSSQQKPTLSLFGTQQQPQQQQALSGSLFGTQSIGQPQQQPFQAPSMFGQTTSIFGAGSNAAAQKPSLFQPIGQFGATATATPAIPAAPPNEIAAQFDEIIGAYDTNDARCRFRHPFFNKVAGEDVQKFGRPTNIPEGLWQSAVKACPDPKSMVPVFASGFEDLNKRIHHQTEQANLHQAKLKELESDLEKIQQTHQVDTTAKLVQLQRQHAHLTQKVLRVMKAVQLLRSRGHTTLFAGEEKLNSRLRELLKRVQRPEFEGRITELQAQAKMQSSVPPTGASSVVYETVDEATLENMTRVLKDIQQGLLQITDLINKDVEGVQQLHKQLTVTATATTPMTAIL